MRFKHPNAWSLGRAEDLLALSLGSAVGIGNFLALPELFIATGGFTVLLVHLLSLILLGGPLLVAEMAWSRWLLRPYDKSFVVLGTRWKWLFVFGFAALIDITPPYVLEVGRLATVAAKMLWLGDFAEAGWAGVARSELESYAGALFILAVTSLVAILPARVRARIVRGLMNYTFLCWACLSWVIFKTWGWSGLGRSLLWDYSRISLPQIFEIFTFSLFTLSAGLGVHYTFVFYASQKSVEEGGDDAWRRPGFLMRTVIWVLVGDFVASLVALVFVSPFAVRDVLGRSSVDSRTIILEWLPEILNRIPGGQLWFWIYLTSFLAAGVAALHSLLDFASFSVESEFKSSRRKAVLGIFVVGVLLSALPLLPVFQRAMNLWGSRVFLPLSALALSLAVGWGMPTQAQRQILGRGPSLDGWHLIWQLSVRWLIPFFLIASALQAARS
jgi:SNF family Na+-dependent transporter